MDSILVIYDVPVTIYTFLVIFMVKIRSTVCGEGFRRGSTQLRRKETLCCRRRLQCGEGLNPLDKTKETLIKISYSHQDQTKDVVVSVTQQLDRPGPKRHGRGRRHLPVDSVVVVETGLDREVPVRRPTQYF